jgi:hypothetical protein
MPATYTHATIEELCFLLTVPRMLHKDYDRKGSLSQSQSQTYVKTDDQSASLSWNKAPIWGLRPDFHYLQTIGGLLIWGALSDDRTGLSFTMNNMYNTFTFTCYYLNVYIQGLCQSRLSTANHILSVVASAYEF